LFASNKLIGVLPGCEKIQDPNFQRGKETANRWPGLWGKKEIGNVLVVRDLLN
jgi:hypothetical protein